VNSPKQVLFDLTNIAAVPEADIPERLIYVRTRGENAGRLYEQQNAATFETRVNVLT
jgi:hypothetical protein